MIIALLLGQADDNQGIQSGQELVTHPSIASDGEEAGGCDAGASEEQTGEQRHTSTGRDQMRA